MVRVNDRVRVGLYSPSKLAQVVIPNKLVSNFKESFRYASVDRNKIRNNTINSTLTKGKIETSITKFVNSPTSKFQRDWIINERPDEKLKRYLRLKKRELREQMQK